MSAAMEDDRKQAGPTADQARIEALTTANTTLANQNRILREKSLQAFDVVSRISERASLDAMSTISGAEFKRARDYFFDAGKFERDFLPWPRERTLADKQGG